MKKNKTNNIILIMLILIINSMLSTNFAQSNKVEDNTSSVIITGNYFQLHIGGGLSYFYNDWGIEILAGFHNRETIYQDGDSSTFRGEFNIIYKNRLSDFYIGGGVISWSGNMNDIYDRRQFANSKGYSIFLGYEKILGIIGIGGRIGYQIVNDLEFVIAEGFSGDYFSIGDTREIMKESEFCYNIYLALRF